MYSISYFADNNSTTLSDIVWVGYSRRFFFLFIPHTYVHIDIRFGKFSFSFSCNSIWLFVLQILFHYFRDSHRDVVTRHAHCMAFSTFVTILANRRTFSLIYVQVVIFSCVSIWKNTSSIDIRKITKRKMFISSDFFLIYMRGMWNKIIGFRLHSMLCRLFLPLLTQNTLNTLYIRLFKHSISASSLSLSSSLFLHLFFCYLFLNISSTSSDMSDPGSVDSWDLQNVWWVVRRLWNDYREIFYHPHSNFSSASHPLVPDSICKSQKAH